MIADFKIFGVMRILMIY